MTKKTKEQIASFLEEKGQQSFPIHISPQSVGILKYMDWTKDEWDEFAAWWIENCAIVAGGQIMHYLDIKERK